MDVILDHHLGVPEPRKPKISQESLKSIPERKEFEVYHSACFDAYMTGFIFAREMLTHNVDEHKNRVYLMNKEIPLRIEKGGFAKVSVGHKKRMENLI